MVVVVAAVVVVVVVVVVVALTQKRCYSDGISRYLDISAGDKLTRRETRPARR